MPGLIMDGINGFGFTDEVNNGERTKYKESLADGDSPKSPPGSGSIDLAIGAAVGSSIEQLCYNIYDMQSSDVSPSRLSLVSYGEESRIDSELRRLAGEGNDESEITKPAAARKKNRSEGAHGSSNSAEEENGKTKAAPAVQPSKFDRSEGKNKKNLRKLISPAMRALDLGGENLESSFLQRLKGLIASGDDPYRSVDLARQAVKSLEKRSDKETSMELVMWLHVLAAIHCGLGQYSDAIPVLERAIEIPNMEEGPAHALPKFAGCMQLGDTYAMLGQTENSMLCYTAGLEIQMQVLGEKDPRVGETCRYVAEANVQALQFDDAEKLCLMALDVHGDDSLEEAADRRLMALICDAKGDREASLEHYVLASMAMAAKGNQAEVAAIDCSIGDAYMALARIDEAVCAYKKALALFRSTKGETHPAVASVYVRMADLHHKIGKFREAKSYCEDALQILERPLPGASAEDIASGLIEISGVYQSWNELDRAVKCLHKARRIFLSIPGQQSTVAGIEAQIGVMQYMSENYSSSYDSLKNAITKLRATGEKKSSFFGVALNQMGLACVQLNQIEEAADLFEEARGIFETELAPYHHETLAVYSNLAATYDAMGRLDDAIEILEYIVAAREDKLGTVNPDVDDEKQRLSELLKEAGRIRKRRFRSLETLLDNNSSTLIKDGTKVG